MTSLLPRVKARVVLHAHRRVRGLLEGEYAAVTTGRGTDFTDLREYVRGDDVKDLDWKASARTGALLVKRFTAERKHHVLLVVATGRGLAAHAEVGTPKRDLAVTVAGVVGWLAVQHGDLVGLLHGDADGVHGLPPRGGELHVERALEQVHEACSPYAAAGDLVALLRHVARTVRCRTILLLVCEDEEPTPEVVALLRRLAVQHEVLVASLGDLDPTTVPAGSAAYDVDVAGGAGALPAWLRDDPVLAAELADEATARHGRLDEALARLGIAHERVVDADGAVRSVLALLQQHRHARGR